MLEPADHGDLSRGFAANGVSLYYGHQGFRFHGCLNQQLTIDFVCNRPLRWGWPEIVEPDLADWEVTHDEPSQFDDPAAQYLHPN